MFYERQGVQKFFQWMFYVSIALFPFVLYEGYLFNGTATRAVNTVLMVEALALVLGVTFLAYKSKKLSIVLSPITGAFAVLLSVLLISSLVGVDFATSFWSKATRTTGMFYFFHLAFLYVFFWVAFAQARKMRTFLMVFAVSAGLFGLLASFGQEGTGWLFASKPWAGLTIGNSTFAGMYMYAGCMIALYLAHTATTRQWWHYVLPFLFIVNPYMLNFDIFRGSVHIVEQPTSFLGSAQASSATLYLSIFILALWWIVSVIIKKPAVRRTILLVATVIATIIFIIAARSLLTPGGKVQQMYLSQATATRPITWEFSQKAIAERPVFGWGVDNFDRVFQRYYDPTILETKNGGEAWLDRAHNIFVDQTVESGYVGTVAYVLVYLAILASLLYVIIKSKVRDDVVLATVLVVYFAGHLLELQTAFDTTITYVPTLCFAGISAILFARTNPTSKTIEIGPVSQKILGAILVVFAVGMFVVCTVHIMKVQGANAAIRRVGSSEKRIPLYDTLFSTKLDRGAFLWRTSNDIQRGVSLAPSVIEDARQREGLKKELEVIVANYEEYLTQYPEDYRATLNLADTYIYQRLFEVNNLSKAHEVLDRAIALVPQSPQAYWMKSVTYLYQAKFKDARLWAQKAYDLNPDIEESTRVRNYIDESVKAFPVIDLYSFKQI
jgi:O-antigen ligase